ncbi:MAG: phosphoenolpyruvate-utilizing N-terminal domain-containing protein, partial [Microcella pacifica]
MAAATNANLLQGVGIGRGTAVGPVIRMPDPVPEPTNTASTLTPDEEAQRAREALAATAVTLRQRGESAGG